MPLNSTLYFCKSKYVLTISVSRDLTLEGHRICLSGGDRGLSLQIPD
jgi:hypothetical protein